MDNDDDIYCKYNKDAYNKGNFISDGSNFGEDADEESDYLVISDDDVDYDGDDDSDACDHLVISYDDIDDDDGI